MMHVGAGVGACAAQAQSSMFATRKRPAVSTGLTTAKYSASMPRGIAGASMTTAHPKGSTMVPSRVLQMEVVMYTHAASMNCGPAQEALEGRG